MGSENEQLKNALRDLAREFGSAGTDLQSIKDTLSRTTKGIDAHRDVWIGSASQQFQESYHSVDTPLQQAIDGLHNISAQFTGLITAIENAEHDAAYLEVPLVGSTTTFVSKVKLPLSHMTSGADDRHIDLQGGLEVFGSTILGTAPLSAYMIWKSNEIAAELIKADQQVGTHFDTIHNDSNNIPDPNIQADKTDLLASPLAPVNQTGGPGGPGGGGSFSGGSGGSIPALGGSGGSIPALGSAGTGVPALGSLGTGSSYGSSIPGLGTSDGSSIPDLGTSDGSSIPDLGTSDGSSIPGLGTSDGSSIPDLAAHGASIPDLAATHDNAASDGSDASQGSPASTDTTASSPAEVPILQGLAIGEMAAAVAAVGLTAVTLGASDAMALSASGGLQAASTGVDTPSVSGVHTLSGTSEEEDEDEDEDEDKEESEDEEPSEDEESSEGEETPEGEGTPGGQSTSEGEGTPGGQSTPDSQNTPNGQNTPDGQTIPEDKKTAQDENTPARIANQKQTQPTKLADTEPIPQLPQKL